MQHKNINELAARRIAGIESNAESAELDSMLRESAENSQRYEQLMDSDEFSKLYKLYSSMDKKRAWSKFSKAHFSHRPSLATVLRYAAMFAVPLVAAAALWLFIGRNERPQMTAEARAAMNKSIAAGKQKAILTTEKAAEDKDLSLRTYPSSEYWITLEDGTIVHLNNNTTLNYPEHFAADSRTVRLSGEAFFQVAKDSKRPFRVLTPDGTITQRGTTFNVDTRGEEGTEVVLVEGSVSIEASNGSSLSMKPSTLALLPKTKSEPSLTPVNVNPRIAWNSGRFAFDDCTLEHIMDVVSEWYGLAVCFDSPETRSVRFTGDIDRYESVAPLLDAIRAATELTITLEGRKINIRKESK